MVERIIPKFVFEKEQLRRIHLSAIYQKLVKPVRKQIDIFSGSVEQWWPYFNLRFYPEVLGKFKTISPIFCIQFLINVQKG